MRLEVARGNGPVDALAKALKKALLPTYPGLVQLELRDYKVCSNLYALVKALKKALWPRYRSMVQLELRNYKVCSLYDANFDEGLVTCYDS